MKLHLLVILAFALGACSDSAADDRDIFEAPDGGMFGGGGGGSSSSGNNSNGTAGGDAPECAAEYGLVNCLDGEHFRLSFDEETLVDSGGTAETGRSYSACGASPTSESPIDDRVILARDAECVAYRGVTREPFVPVSLDAGPINVFSNQQVAALVSQDGCYQPENPVNPLFFEGEIITLDVNGGDDVGAFAGDTRWPLSPEVDPVEIRSDRAFDIGFTAIDDGSEVVAVLETVDEEGVRTKVRCSTIDTGNGTFEVGEELAAELPEEVMSGTLTVTRTTLEELDETAPAFYLIRTGTTAISL